MAHYQMTHCRIDLTACEANQQKPAAIIDRLPTDEWLVSDDAIRMDQPIRWGRVLRESQILIPLVPYLMLPEADMALAFMAQLGMRISLDVGRPIRRLHLATGYPVQEIIDAERGGAMWRYHLGFGIVLG